VGTFRFQMCRAFVKRKNFEKDARRGRGLTRIELDGLSCPVGALVRTLSYKLPPFHAANDVPFLSSRAMPEPGSTPSSPFSVALVSPFPRRRSFPSIARPLVSRASFMVRHVGI
jgi:hypothetical protein